MITNHGDNLLIPQCIQCINLYNIVHNEIYINANLIINPANSKSSIIAA